jgi:hypothetical protein
MVRDEVIGLERLGPLPASTQADERLIAEWEKLLKTVMPPLTDEEARILAGLFGPDDCFGLAWTLLHLIETAPNWPLRDCLEGNANPWIKTLRESARRTDLM